MPIIRHVLEYSVAHARDGVIPDVKILGLNSRNGYRYLLSALGGAVALYENAPVYILHPNAKEKRRGSRQMDHHFGSLKSVHTTNDGMFGDLHYRQSHPMAGAILEKDGHGIGLSHNVHVEMNDDETEVTKIVSVYSVDLVDNPATTHSLFEEEADMLDLAELEAASKAHADQIKEIKEGQGEIKTLLESMAKPAEAPPEKKQRFTALEEKTDPNAPPVPTFGLSRDEFAAGLRGISSGGTG